MPKKGINKNEKNGFTLIELLVVIAIFIMLIIGISIPLALIPFALDLDEKDTERFESIELLEIDNGGNISGYIGNEYKIPLKSSITGNSDYKIFIKNTPPNSRIKRYDGEYYLIWSPKDEIYQDMIVITAYGSVKDEITIKIEAK